ncbi:unnamed protein product [Coregonus sp. 'balchen']|nr:unnamed protein product [Coregonus sp. 'balchen']
MASDGPPGTEPMPSDLGSSVAALNTWSNPELQAKLGELGAPNMGPREEMLDRLKGYMMQTGMMLSKPNLGGDDKPMTPQVSTNRPYKMPGIPPMPPMPMPPMPPGMGMLQAMSMMAGGPPPPGMRMGMEPPGMPPGLSQEDQLKMGDSRAMEEQELLEQQKRAAVMLENERQQELAKRQHGGPGPRMSDPGSRPPGMMPPMMRGVNPGGMNPPPPGMNPGGMNPPPPGMNPEEEEESPEMEMNMSSTAKNRKRRNRKKKNKKRREQEKRVQAEEKKEEDGEKEKEPEVEIEYVTEEPEIYDPNFIFFKRIFEAFKLTDDVKKEQEKEPEKEPAPLMKKKGLVEERKDSDDSDDEIRPDVPKMSKKKLRRMNRLTVAELKQLVARPDVVEMHDVTAQEPKLLVHLKATRNTVPVPRHWCFKRKYLQGKRGIEKPPFELPEFIKRTGIQEMREALQEKEDAKTMKTKMREKVRPKMGKIDIDYQKLHDAFFKWQMKPKLSIHGDLYYESCSFGYHAGGWGKPPVDETGKPLYGDVFGTNAGDFQAKAEEEEVDRTPWGELEPSDEESSEEEEEEESDEEKPDETGFFTPADSGLITPGGFSSVPAGMETPELIELRKKKIEEAMDGNETPQLFTVLPERRTGSGGAAMMASTHIYDVSGAGGGQEFQGVEVALAPEELELDPMAMTQKYEEHVRNQEAQVEKEDFSDMQKKRKAQPQDTRGGAKKYKEFKF